MQFNTNLERTQHPLASLIPEHIWTDPKIFDKILTDEMQNFMRMYAQAQLIPQADYPYVIRRSIWCGLLYTYPNTPDEQLIAWSHQLTMPDYELIELAILTQQFSMLHGFFATTPYNADNIHAYSEVCSKLFQITCKNGDLITLNKLLEWLPDYEKQMLIAVNEQSAFDNAALAGQLTIIQRILAITQHEAMTLTRLSH